MSDTVLAALKEFGIDIAKVDQPKLLAYVNDYDSMLTLSKSLSAHLKNLRAMKNEVVKAKTARGMFVSVRWDDGYHYLMVVLDVRVTKATVASFEYEGVANRWNIPLARIKAAMTFEESKTATVESLEAWAAKHDAHYEQASFYLNAWQGYRARGTF